MTKEVLEDVRSTYLHSLWNLEVQCRIHKGSPVIPIPNRNNLIPPIDTHFLKIHSNIVLLSTPKAFLKAFFL